MGVTLPPVETCVVLYVWLKKFILLLLLVSFKSVIPSEGLVGVDFNSWYFI